MNNYRNNERNQNRRGYNNKKANKQPKVNPNEIKIPLYLPVDLNDGVKNEIYDVLESTKFDKISIPLGIYRNLIEDCEEGDTRVCTIGYIRSYDAESAVFTVVLFSKYANMVKELGMNNLVLELMFNTYNDTLRTITKFNIACIPSDNEETENKAETIDE